MPNTTSVYGFPETETHMPYIFGGAVESDTNYNVSNVTNATNTSGQDFNAPPTIANSLQTSDIVTLPFYALIFIAAVAGNLLVILTLVQNKRMRTVTNVFLLNLSVSDLLLAVFCMPFTIIPVMLKNFIFGEIICVMIRYLQGGCQLHFFILTLFKIYKLCLSLSLSL